MSLMMFRLGLRQCPGSTVLRTPAQASFSNFATTRSISNVIRNNNITYTQSRPSLSIIKSLSYTPKSIFRYVSTVQQAPRSSESTVLNWSAFFELRKSRRRYSLFSSIAAALATGFAGFAYLAQNPEAVDAITGVLPDPIMSLGVAIVGFLLLGWLLGPVVGNTVWNLVHRSIRPQFSMKEKTFFERIKRHRVNPQGATANNPVPDFYGEKISSVSGYRQWLKDQRVFNKKREGTYSGPSYPVR